MNLYNRFINEPIDIEKRFNQSYCIGINPIHSTQTKMTQYKDHLGTVVITTEMLEAARNWRPTITPVTVTSPSSIQTGPLDWTVVQTFNASKGSSIHTVERKDNDLKCSCQGFRIRKLGYCKHTEIVKKQLGL